MISGGVVFASVLIFVVGFFAGVLVHMAGDGTTRRWLELRHELRLKVLEQRERWLDKEAGKP